ncbi:MAG: hypothetical protein ABIH03_16675 [Pseudomonadota bacterium]
MNDDKRFLKGSDRRDTFKQMHKIRLGGGHWGSDLDFMIVDKYPPGIVAFFDYKEPGRGITFAEIVAYNALLSLAPLFIIEGPDPENGPFVIKRYKPSDWRPNRPVANLEFVEQCPSWVELGNFEDRLKREYRKRSAR